MNIFLEKNNPPNYKIIFFLFSLGIGGTERQTVELAKGLKKKGYQPIVYCFDSSGKFAKELRRGNILVRKLPTAATAVAKNASLVPNNALARKITSLLWRIRFGTTRRFIELLKKDQPDLIYSFGLYPFILSITAKVYLKTKIIWGIRASFIDYSKFGWLKKRNFWISILLVRLFDKIIANSEAGKRLFCHYGYPKNKIIVVPNGIDVEHFTPSQKEGHILRHQLGIDDKTLLIGHCARLDPVKDHPTFFEAIKIYIINYPKTRFLIAGAGDEIYINALKKNAQTQNIDNNIVWLGAYEKMNRFYNAIDFLTLTSISEGFPNVVGEAMACGKPVVATNVGDCALIVKGTGIVIPASNPVKLAKAWAQMNEKIKKDQALSHRCRQKISNQYSLDLLVDRFRAIIAEL